MSGYLIFFNIKKKKKNLNVKKIEFYIVAKTERFNFTKAECFNVTKGEFCNVAET